jgi:putative ABC transport system permease protein
VPRTGASVLGSFALAALVLSIVGLYGALAFAVALRSRELAIRRALGAEAARVVWVVARHALAIVSAGIVLGGALSFFAGKLLRSQIPSVGAADPVACVSAVLLLMMAAALSAWIPARRAVRVDPAVVLRGE